MSSTLGKTDSACKFGGLMKLAGLAALGACLALGGCNKLKQENEALTKENAELREAKTAAETQKTGLEQRNAALQSENQMLSQKAMASGTQQPYGGPDSYPEPKTKGHGGPNDRTIEISSDVLFGPGSATLKPDSKRELDKVASQVRTARSVVIEGYTDSDPIKRSHWKSNEALSKARADAVRDYLVSKGVSKTKISTVGKGASDPRATKQESRRVDIVVAE